mmetsp:Transcript_19886/g.27785  ORF Transcript_19886/g.27785 Transcript_19886/m.27785 type:complete len:89 (+) Transcript_19886:210-476(+)
MMIIATRKAIQIRPPPPAAAGMITVNSSLSEPEELLDSSLPVVELLLLLGLVLLQEMHVKFEPSGVQPQESRHMDVPPTGRQVPEIHT